MFEDYLQDAYRFYTLANECARSNEREAKMYYRAAVFCGASALEAFVNFIGDTFKQGDTLDKNEIAFLNDKVLEIASSKATIEEKTKYYSIESKVKFILVKFNASINPSNSAEWSNFTVFKNLRDNLVHSRSIDDEMEIGKYKSEIKKGLNANIDIMNAISQAIFSKKLRKNLLDMKL